MDLRGKRVVVVGLGRSGVAAAALCQARGALVALNDASPAERWSLEAKALVAAGAVAHAGHHEASVFEGADVVVISPGVPPPPALRAFEAAGGEVLGEMELASRFVDAPIALIGGTNGKSTTTALLHAMLLADGKKAFIGGNFGQPLAEVVDQPWDVLVLEISSFQAERVPTLRAKVHALLNITDDHLDRYASFADYAHAKGNPFVNMSEADVAVIPAGTRCARPRPVVGALAP
jgi:UDP-N-acetylmuramoylalanine--D-glutamate ligase